MRPAPLPLTARSRNFGRGQGLGLALGMILTATVLAACKGTDGRALQKLACEHAVANLDMHSVAQMDALRKALGVAPGVDPINTCKALGADMTPQPSPKRP